METYILNMVTWHSQQVHLDTIGPIDNLTDKQNMAQNIT